MSKISVEYSDGKAEISACEEEAFEVIEYVFWPVCNGFVNIGSESYRVRDGVCSVNTARLTDGEIYPVLALDNQKIALPPMIREGEVYKIKDYDASCLRRISLSALRLEKRISELEKRMDELSKRVYNTTIF